MQWLDKSLDGAVGIYIGMACAAAFFVVADEKPTWGWVGSFLAFALGVWVLLCVLRVRAGSVSKSD